MRYYCPECKTEIITCPRDTECLYCGAIMTVLPDFETPKQYEKRTGKRLSDKAAVWYKRKHPLDGVLWGISLYQNKRGSDQIIIVVESPEPPPDDWKPV